MNIEKIEALLIEIKELTKAGKLIMLDGKIDMNDIGTAVNLLTRIPAIVECAKDASIAFEEVKDLDALEVIALVEVIAKHVKEIELA